MELNPNHPTTQQVSQHWHAICAALMSKMALDHVVITTADLALMEPGCAITITELHDGLHLRIVSRDEAEALARRAGGAAVMSHTVTESIFDGATHIIPLADVSHIRKHEAQPSDGGFPGIPEGIIVCLKSFSSTIFLHGDEAAAFMRSWCTYRRELEGGTLAPIQEVAGDCWPAPSPFEQLKAKIQTDSDLAWLWHRDIALCHTSSGEAGLIDGEARHKAANSGAARFMRFRFGVDTTQHPDYPREA